MSANRLGEVASYGQNGLGLVSAYGQVPNYGQGGTSGVPIIFGTEWRTATGTSDNAFLDASNPLGYVWDGVQGANTGPASEIIAANSSLVGRGNYFRVNNAGSNSRQVRKDNLYPESTTHWGRVYFRAIRTTGNHRHFVSVGGLSGNPIQMGLGAPTSVGTQSGNTFLNIAGAYNEAGTLIASPNARWVAAGVDNASAFDPVVQSAWYLFEWQMLYRTATFYTLSAKLSPVDANGIKTVVDKWTTDDFKNTDFNVGNTNNLLTWPSANAAHGLGGVGGTPANARRYLLGNEGPASAVTDSGYFELASFAISTTGWIGDQSLGL